MASITVKLENGQEVTIPLPPSHKGKHATTAAPHHTFFSSDPAQKEPLTPIQYATRTLQKTREAMWLGSANITAIQHDPGTDAPLIVEGLLAGQDPETRSRFNALTDPGTTIKQQSRKQIKEYARISFEQLLDYHAPAGESEDSPKNFAHSEYNHAKLCLKAHAGNCADLSHCALIKLIESGYQGTAEIMEFRNLDHFFLVLNRPQESNHHDWKTWGKDTIILDVWINQVFRANEFGNIWKKYSRLPGLKFNLDEKITDYFDTSIKDPKARKESLKKAIGTEVRDFVSKADDPEKFLFETCCSDVPDYNHWYREFLKEEHEHDLPLTPKAWNQALQTAQLDPTDITDITHIDGNMRVDAQAFDACTNLQTIQCNTTQAQALPEALQEKVVDSSVHTPSKGDPKNSPRS